MESVINQESVVPRKITVHDLRGLDSGEVYDESQCDEAIHVGDVLLTDEGIAIMYSAWPTMVFGTSDELHKLKTGSAWPGTLDALRKDDWGVSPDVLQEGLLVAWALACG